MAADAREKGDRQERTAEEAELSARSERLGERLGKFAANRAPGSGQSKPPAADPSAIARGFRLSTELVAGVLLGAAIGWLIDRGFGITPWGMIVFLLLGFAAGVLNVMRSAGVAPGNRFDGADRK